VAHPVILSTWEAEIRISLSGQPGQKKKKKKVGKIPSQRKKAGYGNLRLSSQLWWEA
jgi:hypothetical protein